MPFESSKQAYCDHNVRLTPVEVAVANHTAAVAHYRERIASVKEELRIELARLAAVKKLLGGK